MLFIVCLFVVVCCCCCCCYLFVVCCVMLLCCVVIVHLFCHVRCCVHTMLCYNIHTIQNVFWRLTHVMCFRRYPSVGMFDYFCICVIWTIVSQWVICMIVFVSFDRSWCVYMLCVIVWTRVFMTCTCCCCFIVYQPLVICMLPLSSRICIIGLEYNIYTHFEYTCVDWCILVLCGLLFCFVVVLFVSGVVIYVYGLFL